MVCLGNICRSPMAEGILRQKALDSGLEMEIDSCGTSSYHLGSAPDSRAIDNLNSKGINISQLKARQFKPSDFKKFDYIFAMDAENLSNILAQTKSKEEKQKASLILDLSFPNESASVPDPYFGGEKGFEKVYDLLNQTCDIFIEKLK